jgi:hypothetical protein
VTCNEVCRPDGEENHVDEAGGVDEDLELVGIMAGVDEIEQRGEGAQQRGIEEEPSPGQPVILDVFDHRVMRPEADPGERFDHLAMLLRKVSERQRRRERERQRASADLVGWVAGKDK